MKAVIFDMDGVIVDSEPLHAMHLEAFLINIGVSQPVQIGRNLKGVNATETWTFLIEEFHLTESLEDLVDRSRQSYIEYLENLQKIPEIPGAVELVKYLHKTGYKLALASSANPKRIVLFLKKLNLTKYFSVIVSGDDVEHSKPSPDIFLLAAKKLRKPPGQCIVIEDADNGVAAAKAAGMACIAYGGSVHNTDDLSAADLIVKDFGALTGGLKNGTLPV